MPDGPTLTPQEQVGAITASEIAAYLDSFQSDLARQAAIGRFLDAGPQATRAFWSYVEGQRGLRVGAWVFIADPAQVAAVLRNDTEFSVCEYDRRMRATSGRFYLGMDPPEHDRDAAMGAIIPSWNQYPPKGARDTAVLHRVMQVAERACREALANAGLLAKLAQLTDEGAVCRASLPQLFGPVLDACAAECFGIAGPSSLSLFLWAKELTWYHFRAYADDAGDRACARQASGQYAAHVKAAIAAIAEPPEGPRKAKLEQIVAKLREHSASASDEDIARVLSNILTGALTATYKAFSDAVILYARSHRGEVPWPVSRERSLYPLYEQMVSRTLVEHRRGSLDAVYRTFIGAPRPFEGASVDLKTGDRVIVWLGGSLQREPDNLFGVGLHKCPGMDMGKAMIEGALRALARLTSARPPRLERERDLDYLVFAEPDALIAEHQP